ncbi:MAG: hypothetical protein N2053_12735, partial [Chitinispirillaceae bacterium]|nr:hypothetical protein [Chitinispirillaceae bacterium]
LSTEAFWGEPPYPLYNGMASLIDTITTDMKWTWVGGLGVTEEYILVLDNINNIVILVDKENGKSIKSFKLEGDYYMSALTAATKRGSFFVFNEYNLTIEERKLEDGSLVNEFSIPSKVEYPTGAGYSNALNILYVSKYNGKIFALNPDSGTILFSGKAGKNVYVYGLGSDECAGPPEWLSLSPTSGVVQGKSQVNVGVTFDASLLEVGNYKAEIKIKPKDPVAPGPFVVPCNLSVTEGELAKRK